LEHFDEDVHHRLRLQLADAQARLDRVGQRFWALTRAMLHEAARFDDTALAFDLQHPPRPEIATGRYHLVSKAHPRADDADAGSGDGGHFLYRLSHPLGLHVLDRAKSLPTPDAHLSFDLSTHPTRVTAVEALRGRSGHLTLIRLTVDSYEREEYLLFSGFDDAGTALDQETVEKLFGLGALAGPCELSAPVQDRLAREAERHTQATISRSLELNNGHFQEAREKLERWAEDLVHSAEKALLDTKEQIKVLRREARQATTLAEQHAIQERIQKLERQQRKQRQEIFAAEDEVYARRDRLVDELERRMAQHTAAEVLFSVRWTVT